MVSPYINRFLQPDSIIPNPANPQSFNRFLYVYNRPIIFTDPTGHDAYWCETASCQASYYTAKKDGFFAAYGVQVDKNMTPREKLAIMVAIAAVGKKASETRGKGETAAEAFMAVFEPITFVKSPDTDGCLFKNDPMQIDCNNITYANFQSDVNNVVHELGHFLSQLVGGTPNNFGWMYAEDRSNILRPYDGIYWQHHPVYDTQDPVGTGGEMFGDMLIAWTFDAWNTNPDYKDLVDEARDKMNTNMAGWLNR